MKNKLINLYLLAAWLMTAVLACTGLTGCSPAEKQDKLHKPDKGLVGTKIY